MVARLWQPDPKIENKVMADILQFESTKIAIGAIGWVCEAGVVIAIAPSDAQRNACRIIRCSRCGKTSRPIRLTELKSHQGKPAHQRSCGCWSKKVGLDHADAKASSIPAETLSKIFAEVKENGRFIAAEKYGITAFQASRAMHLRLGQIRTMDIVTRRGIRAVCLSSRRGVKRAMDLFMLNRAEVLTVKNQVRRESAANNESNVVAFPTPAQRSFEILLDAAQTAWLTLDDPALRSTSLATLGAKIVAGIEQVAGRALAVTSGGSGDYSRTLNSLEFSTPGTVGAAKSKTALNWIHALLSDLPSDLLCALGPKVSDLLSLMVRSVIFRTLKLDEIQARIRLGIEVERSSYRPTDRICIPAPEGIEAKAAASIVWFATATALPIAA